MIRYLSTVFILIALLAACGGQPAAQPPAAPTAPTAQPTTAPAATSAAAPTAPAATAYPRTVKDAGGREIVLQQRPERVVLGTYWGMLDELLLLDIAPLGYAAWAEERLPIWTQQTLDARGLQPINFNGQAYPAEINLEQLAAANPDLIILAAADGKAENVENFALFEQIAPVFVTDWASQGYDRPRLFAALFGVEEKIAEIEARDNELFATVVPPPPGTELVVGFGYGASGPIATQICHGQGESSALVLVRAGFTLKDFGRPANEGCFDLAEENFGQLDTDMLWNVSPYPGTDGNPVPADARAFESSPIFQNLTVVKESRYRSLNVDQSQALLQWTPLATPFLVETLNELVASYNFPPAVSVPNSSSQNRTVTITDASGETITVSANPQRVVVLSELDLDSALALGIVPVGSVNGRGQASLPQYLVNRASDTVSVGTIAEPSLEAIVALNPDLILAGSPPPPPEALIPELQKIAPVVVTHRPGEDWKRAMATAAQALNRSAEADAFLAAYNERTAAVQLRLPDDAREANVARWMAQGPVVMMPNTFSSLVLADIGLTRPAAVAELAGSHGAHTDPLSLEQLTLLESDWLFLGTLNPEGTTALEAARQNPLFQQLAVVREQRVVEVDGAVWTSVGGPLAALAVLNDVERALEAR